MFQIFGPKKSCYKLMAVVAWLVGQWESLPFQFLDATWLKLASRNGVCESVSKGQPPSLIMLLFFK